MLYFILFYFLLFNSVSFDETEEISAQFRSPLFVPSPLFKPHGIIFTYATCRGLNRATENITKLGWFFGQTWHSLTISWTTARGVIFTHPVNFWLLSFLIFTERAIIKVSNPIAEQKLVGLILAKENHHHHIMANFPVKSKQVAEADTVCQNDFTLSEPDILCPCFLFSHRHHHCKHHPFS